MSLPPLRGHQRARMTLARTLTRGELPAALLIHGEPGIGKQRFALWLAQLMVCERPHADGPCEACRACRLAERLEHPDIHWYFPLERPSAAGTEDKLADALEEARQAALAEIRAQPLRPPILDAGRGIYLAAVRTLRRNAYRRPAMAKRQVFVIGEAERLVPQEASPHAANALLKLLEEPPEHTTFILTSNEPGALLPTIRSRTLAVRLARLPVEDVHSFLTELAGVPEDAAARASLLSGGSIGRALGFLPSNGKPGPYEVLRQEARALMHTAIGAGTRGAFESGLRYPPAGARSQLELFEFLIAWLRDIAACAAGAHDAVLNLDSADELKRLAARARVTPGTMAVAIAEIERTRALATGNVNPQLLIATLLTDLRGRLRFAPAQANAEGGSRQ